MCHRVRVTLPRRVGFTIVEVGLVLAVLSVLISGVLIASGFIGSSRVGSTIQMVNTIQNAAREYAKRKNGSLSFAGVSTGNLQLEGLLPQNMLTPYKTSITIAPHDNANEFSITFTVERREACLDLGQAVRKMAKWRSSNCNPKLCPNNRCEVVIYSQ